MNSMAGRRGRIINLLPEIRNYFTTEGGRVIFKTPYIHQWTAGKGCKRNSFHDIGEVFGKHHGNGRWQATFFGEDIYEHEVSWLLIHDTLPEKGLHIDHINGDPLDNSASNLRCVSHRSNIQNQRKAKGFSWSKKREMWESYITHNYKRVGLGMYETELDARAAYLRAKIKYHPDTVIL